MRYLHDRQIARNNLNEVMAFIRPETISEESVMMMVQSFLSEVAYKMR
nr:hypothetical protein [Ligilactobacillus ruminis]